jgi:hypothetical protein
VSPHPWFGQFTALRTTKSAREVRDILQRELADCGVRLDPEFLPAQPFLAPESSYHELFTAAFALLRLLKQAVLRAHGTTEARLAAVAADESDYPLFTDDLAFEERYCDLMARPDAVIGPDGLKFLEFNVSGTFGGTTETHVLSGAWHRIYGGREMSGFWGHDPYEARARTLRSVQRETGDRSGIAFVGRIADIPDVTSSRYYDREIQYLRAAGQRAALFEPQDLLEGLGLPGRPRYGVGLRYFNVMDWHESGIDFAPVRAAVAAGLRLVPSQTCHLLANKKVLSWISEGRPWMTDADRAIVERYLPWTREVRPGPVSRRGRSHDMADLLTARQEEFVLKQAIGLMGLQVLIGRETEPELWRKAVHAALEEGGSIVQEFVEPATVPIVLADGNPDGRMTVEVAPVLSPCLYGTDPGGCHVKFFADGRAGVVSAWGHGALENVLMARTADAEA